MIAVGNRSSMISTSKVLGTPACGDSLPTAPVDATSPVIKYTKLIYIGRLPKIVNHQVHHMATNTLMKKARLAFGTLPPFLYPRTRAYVRITRVLGPRQHDMDDDSLAALLVGLRDALKPSYIVDDSPRWATVRYFNDGTRRDVGPFIEVEIYLEGS